MIEGQSIWLEGERLNGKAAASLLRRSHLYGDGLFETMRVRQGHILFWESHYFRLMSSMRILRMDIPDTWSPEALQQDILACCSDHEHARVRLTVWREGSLGYTPDGNHITWSVISSPLNDDYPESVSTWTADLFQEHRKPKQLLSNLKATSSALYVLASQFAKDQHVDEALILNDDKKVIESCRGNLFILKGDKLTTAPLVDGPLRGVMREQIINLAPSIGLTVEEESVSPFALQQADELWLSNAIHGVVAISRFRRHDFGHKRAQAMQMAIVSKSKDVQVI